MVSTSEENSKSKIKIEACTCRKEEKPISSISKFFKCSPPCTVLFVLVALTATITILVLKCANFCQQPMDRNNNHNVTTNKNSRDDNIDPTKTPINHNDEAIVSSPDGNGLDDNLTPLRPGTIIEKKKWGGRPAVPWNTSLALKHPTPFVVITHTVTPQCHNFDECSARIQSIQALHVFQGTSPDIRFNFLVGGDGNAYVGRGWDVRNSETPNSIGIAFIGNYVYDYLTPEMINVTQKLLRIGIEKGKLAQNYKLLAHNQTQPTESPGGHIYEVIKTWPHFNPTVYI